jgi:hypothetical protein
MPVIQIQPTGTAGQILRKPEEALFSDVSIVCVRVISSLRCDIQTAYLMTWLFEGQFGWFCG